MNGEVIMVRNAFSCWLALASLLLSANLAQSCECTGEPSPRIAFKEATAVFTGRIVRTHIENLKDENSRRLAADFEIYQVLKPSKLVPRNARTCVLWSPTGEVAGPGC